MCRRGSRQREYTHDFICVCVCVCMYLIPVGFTGGEDAGEEDVSLGHGAGGEDLVGPDDEGEEGERGAWVCVCVYVYVCVNEW